MRRPQVHDWFGLKQSTRQKQYSLWSSKHDGTLYGGEERLPLKAWRGFIKSKREREKQEDTGRWTAMRPMEDRQKEPLQRTVPTLDQIPRTKENSDFL